MNPIVIRKAVLEDIKYITPLMQDLGYPTDESALTKRFNEFISQDGYGVAVCCAGEIIVGFVAWSKSTLFVSNATRFHIEAIIVSKQHRGLGIGKMLMEHVEKIAQNHSPAIVDLTSGKRREKDGSHEFYKRLGYKNEGHMAKLYLRKNL